MLAAYERRTNIGVGAGLLVSIAGRVLTVRGYPQLGLLIALAGFILFIWGCAEYCNGKGQSPWLGLFGILSIFGLLVLFFLPDRHKDARATAGTPDA